MELSWIESSRKNFGFKNDGILKTLLSCCIKVTCTVRINKSVTLGKIKYVYFEQELIFFYTSGKHTRTYI